MSAAESTLRSQIDALDEVLVQLLRERAAVSHQIQRHRMSSGGARVDLARERDVIANYTAALGVSGAEFATTVLAYCRGRVEDAVAGERAG